MPVFLYVLSVQRLDFVSERSYEFIFYILVYQDVIRCYAGLSAVECLAPCDPFCSHLDVSSPVDDAWTLAPEFEYYWGKVPGGSGHDCPCKCRASCEEDEVPSLLQKSGIHSTVSLNHSDVFLIKSLGNHFLDHFRYCRNIWRWFEDGCAAG